MKGRPNSEAAFLDAVRQETPQILELVRRLVELESPTPRKDLVDRVGAFLCDFIRAQGGVPQVETRREVGDIVWTEWDPGGEGRTLVLCHTDTVWDEGMLQRNPFRIENGRAYGPGVLDMKGGIALTLKAQEYLGRGWIRPRRKLRFVYTTDEELFSSHSQELICDFARISDLVLVLEPPTAEGALKTARKGVGNFTLKVFGRAAHAGVEPEKGVNALEELARQILKLHALSDPEQGTSVVVAVASGGTRDNVVPEYAEARIDTRFKTLPELERVEREIRSLAPFLPGARLEVAGGIDRPPMVRTANTEELFERARGIAAALGISLAEAESGGASDGNFTAALGVPTLDGLGIDGEGIHALNEHIRVEAVAPRTALFARLVEKL